MSTWDIATTAKASSGTIQRFLAYHLSIGVGHIYMFLDAPSDQELVGLEPHPKVTFFFCDEDYWANKLGRDRPETHPRRQIVNATYAYNLTTADWIAHVDVDEFIVPSRPMDELLGEISRETAALRVMPAELLFKPNREDNKYQFKFPVHWKQRSSPLLSELFPTYGAQLVTGLVSHAIGKTIVRTGMPLARFGIHRVLFRNGKPEHQELRNVFLGHFHSDGIEDFCLHLDYRLSSGSYGGVQERSARSLFRLLQTLRDIGPAAIKDFHDEVCSTNPHLICGLRRHSLLEEVQIDFDAMVKEFFPGEC